MLTILGATGRVGRIIATSLLEQGVTPHLLIRRPDAARAWRTRGADVSIVDLADLAGLTRALTGTTALFAIVPETLGDGGAGASVSTEGRSGVGAGEPGAADVEATRRAFGDALAASVRAAGVAHVVLLSSVATTGPARALRHAEARLATAGCTLTTLRAPYFQDNVASAIAFARDRGVVANLFPSAQLAIPMIATADVAAEAVRRLRDSSPGGRVVTFAAPRYSTTGVATQLSAALGRGLDVVTVPAGDQVEFLRAAGLPPEHAAGIVELHAELAAAAAAPDLPTAVAAPTTLRTTIAALMTGSDMREITAVIDELTAAWNRHDLAAMGALYRADADFVNIFGGHLRGRGEIVREHVERHRVMFARAVMTTGAIDVRVLREDVAIARVEWWMRGITGPGGAPARDRAGLVLHVLERRAGAWTIVTTQNTELSDAAPRRFLDLAS